MNQTHVRILQDALKHIEEGKKIQYKKRIPDYYWADIVTLSMLNDCILGDYEIRVKPEPVFKEVAIFKHKKGSYSYAVEKDYKFPPPEQWERISDWVKVEIKDVSQVS